MMGCSPRSYIPSFVEIGPPVPEKKILKGFYHIWAWPSWSGDPHAANKISFSFSNQGGQVVSERMFEHCERQTEISDRFSHAKLK